MEPDEDRDYFRVAVIYILGRIGKPAERPYPN